MNFRLAHIQRCLSQFSFSNNIEKQINSTYDVKELLKKFHLDHKFHLDSEVRLDWEKLEDGAN